MLIRTFTLAVIAFLLSGCVSFPGYPNAEGATLFDSVAPTGGTVWVDYSVERYMNSDPSPDFSAYEQQNWPRMIWMAYTSSGVFTGFSEGRDSCDYFAKLTIRDYGSGSEGWMFLSGLTLFILPSTWKSEIQVHTELFDSKTGTLLGEASASHRFRSIGHLFMLPFTVSNSENVVHREVIYGLARKGLAEIVNDKEFSPVSRGI